MRSIRFVISGLIAAAALSSCEGSGQLWVGALSVSPALLAFGDVDVGLSNSVRVSITNPSRNAVPIPSIKIASDPNGELSLADQLTTDCKDAPRAASATLAGGECARFTVVWTPKSAHTAAGSVEIDPSPSTTNLNFTLPVSGRALGSDFPLLGFCVLDATGAVDPTQCSNLGAHPPVIPSLDFGSGQLHVASSLTVRLTNLGAADLLFTTPPALTPATAPQFVLPSSTLALLAPHASADLTITATPTALGTLIGELDLATNDPRAALVAVPLHLATTGIAICVEPSLEVDFGLALIGSSPEKSFALTNCGQDDITVDSYLFTPVAPTTQEFSLTPGAAPVLGATVHPSGQLQARVTYSPTATENDLAALDLNFANAYGVNRTRVRLTGTGVTTFCGTPIEPRPAPVITASHAASSGGPYTVFDPTATPSPVEPLDYIKLDGTSQIVGTQTISWSIVSQPAGSTASLNSESAAHTSLQTLVSGDYVIALTISDAQGCSGTSQITIHVVPTGDVHIELTWKESCGDVDLHYVGPGGQICDQNDTAYYNPNPDWGCTTANCGHEQDPGGLFPDGVSNDDPTLDRDDLWGYGPENITQQKPFDSPVGTPYQIWVHYYSATPDGGGGTGVCGQAHPTINIYLGGVLANTFTLPSGLNADNIWHAADLAISNQGKTVAVLPGDTAAINSHVCQGNTAGGRMMGSKKKR